MKINICYYLLVIQCSKIQLKQMKKKNEIIIAEEIKIHDLGSIYKSLKASKISFANRSTTLDNVCEPIKRK